ncbi:LamG domain-containing protein [Flavobacterium sp.]|uniref:LamG domain-containing protein n=1 Tax=Flavobacterium sp. TaxID=239 RepID=UPI0032669CB1
MKKLILAFIIICSVKVNAQEPIHEFNFNGTLDNTKNTISFMGSENYVTDRMGIANNAQRLTNKALEATIDDLPQYNSQRTITIWVKMNDISLANYIWGYGTAYNSQYFGLLHQGAASSNSNLSLAGWGASNDIIVNTPLEINTWYNYSVTFDGKISKIYRNGQLIKAIKGILRNTKGTIFRLGEINTTIGINADIDDLKIYSIALSEHEILSLYNSSKPLLAKETVSLETKESIASKKEIVTTSNPKSKVVENSESIIKRKTLKIKKVEIFSQGEKVLSNNSQEINMNDLPEGTYLLKITNLPTKKVTSK